MSALHAAIAAGRLIPWQIMAILGKTEGNGCVNDFTRAFAVQSVRLALASYLPAEDVATIPLIMSGGTEGALAPHWLVFARDPAAHAGDGPALAIGRARTRPLLPEEIGRRVHVDLVAGAVRAAMAEARLDQAEDVHFVQIKCPLLTMERVESARQRGAAVAVQDTLKSMGVSRGAAALGVAIALAECAPDAVGDGQINRDRTVFSARASASAGIELLDNEVVVLGMSRHWSGPLAIDHAVMADAVDVEPVRAALARLGLASAGQLTPAQTAAVAAVLAKAEPSTNGQLRGARHTMLDDSDISATRHARAFVAGVLAGLIGHAELFVSGGAEHQGPDGGGPVAIIVDRSHLNPEEHP
jgi:cyanuric acid amidohydrolase